MVSIVKDKLIHVYINFAPIHDLRLSLHLTHTEEYYKHTDSAKEHRSPDGYRTLQYLTWEEGHQCVSPFQGKKEALAWCDEFESLRLACAFVESLQMSLGYVQMEVDYIPACPWLAKVCVFYLFDKRQPP